MGVIAEKMERLSKLPPISTPRARLSRGQQLGKNWRDYLIDGMTRQPGRTGHNDQERTCQQSCRDNCEHRE
jgi:hypothetical protein